MVPVKKNHVLAALLVVAAACIGHDAVGAIIPVNAVGGHYTRKDLKNMCVAIENRMLHPDETLATYVETPKTFATYTCNMHVYATSRSTFTPSRRNI